MKLILARHAEAGDHINDFERQITDRGRQDVQRMAFQIAGTGWNFRDIRHSPLVRTRETAETIQKAFETTSGVLIPSYPENRLQPGVDPETVLDLLSEYESKDAAIWIFHAPDVSYVASQILGLPERCFYFPPGAMLALNLPLPSFQDRSMLIWMMQPEYVEKVIVFPESI